MNQIINFLICYILNLISESIAPADQLAGSDNKIHEERKKKIQVARLTGEINITLSIQPPIIMMVSGNQWT